MTPSTEPRAICRRCSASLAPGACADLCPACLAEMALLDEPEPEVAAVARLGDYDLIEELGRGGMGVVWRARQRSLNRIVALKTLTTRLPGEDSARRFQREAEAAAALRHPHIVAVYEVGESEGSWYLSMELVDGGSLAGRLSRSSLSAREAAGIVASVARAVQHAHERGVLHRDLKPANILLDSAGEPRVADFGLARIEGLDATLTHSGLVLGTPAYMSPEQATGRSKDLTTASDIYSLGAVLYELLTNRPPFTGDSSVAVLRRVADEEPARPSAIKRGIDADLETICMRCLEKEPAARYRSMLAFAGDLERWLNGEPILARRVKPAERVWKWARRRPALAALWGAVAVLVVVVAIVATALSVSLARYNKTVVASAETLRHQLAREFAGSSQRLVENDDWLRALPPLAEAIRLGTGNERLDRANRVRFATLVRSSPELRYVWADGRKIIRVETDVEGKRLLIVTPQSADIWELEPRPSLKHRWNAPQEWRLGGMSNDGARVVLTNAKDHYTLFDAKSGEMLGEGDGSISFLGAYGQQGRHFITFSGTSAVVHSGRGGEAILPQLQHHAPVAWATNLPWLRCTLTQDKSGQLYLWNSAGELSVPPFKVRESSEPLALAAISRTTRVIALQGGKDLYLVNGVTGELIANVQAAGGPQTIGLDSIGGWVYLARRDTGVEVREVERDVLRFSAVHGALGFRGAFAPSADLLATQSWNGSARVWRLSNGRPESPLIWQPATPGDCLLDQKGSWLLTRSDEPAIRLWRLRRGDDSALRDVVAYEPLAAWFDGSPERIRLAERKGRVHTMDPATGRIVAPPIDHGEPILVAAPCDGKCRVFTCGSSCARLWNAVDGTAFGRPFVSSARIISGSVDNGGQRIAAMVEQVGIVVWDCPKGTELCRIAGSAIRCEFSPQGTALLVVRDDGAQVFDPNTGTALSPFVVEAEKRTDAHFSPDGRRVLQWSRTTRAGQNAARIWNSATGAIETTLEAHWRAIDEAVFSPDGRFVASGGEDHILRICDSATGKPAFPPRRHRSQVRKVGFSPDSSFVWAVSDNDVHVWDTAAAELVGPRLRHPKDPVAFAWSADSQRFVTVGDSFSPRLWSFVPDNRSPEELAIIARGLSAHELSAGTSDLDELDLEESRAAWRHMGVMD